MSLSRTFVLLCLFCLGFASILIASCGDRNESFYPSLTDADKAGAITRGWIPADLIPASSRAIHETHELSPSTEWCAFEFSPADSQGFRKNLKSIDTLPPSVSHVPSPGASWWPVVLRGNLEVEKIHKAGFELYVAERPANSVNMDILLFAVDWARGRAFFYSTGELDSQ